MESFHSSAESGGSLGLARITGNDREPIEEYVDEPELGQVSGDRETFLAKRSRTGKVFALVLNDG